MKKLQTILTLLLLVTGVTCVSGQTSVEIEKAAKSCKPVFLVAYNADGADTDKAFAIANDAKKALKGSSVVIKMNVTDAANNGLISKYRLAGAPLPLILVLDKNGTAAGGLALKEATSGKLIDMIPSPKTSELIKALADGKSVYIVVYKESMASKKSIVDNCAVACSKMENKSATVIVSLEDKGETKLLQMLKVDPNAKEPVTYVINKSGQIAGTYTGVTNVNTLVSTAKKAPAGGCCAGGSSSGCGKK
jgi:hypothetical protein